ncbi:phospholipid/glycerol acyltransferase [Gloeothece citriformis PCC 7424]|uniref:Phospholipid/glycerol acyltransferase n=1 Tax=Gloeothece citriformis (strain PCC 7424) TaxID=65393 RepID=B7KJL7_GLOC7|nr:1-acyl-sn-glycerol-3-phosphate acyltransferase [Gloeothece citriformis]ACK73694.1 phospholipid/glycerol acyltransferase [Gloeothece citriformis PCC 7424]
MSQQMPSRENLTYTKETSIRSYINPLLIRLVYPLGCYIVLPSYFGKLEVTGQDNIPTTGPVIVAPTHRSRWDALLTPYAVGRLASGRDLRFMVMATEMQGIQGWLIRQLGGFPVNTERPGAGSLVHTIDLLSRGEMVVIFPQGGIVPEIEVERLKPGVARLALEVETHKPNSGMKILPVNIQYTDLSLGWKTDVTINIGKPIDVAKYNQGKIKENTRKLTAELKTALQQLQEKTPLSQESKEMIMV